MKGTLWVLRSRLVNILILIIIILIQLKIDRLCHFGKEFVFSRGPAYNAFVNKTTFLFNKKRTTSPQGGDEERKSAGADSAASVDKIRVTGADSTDDVAREAEDQEDAGMKNINLFYHYQLSIISF